MCAPCRGYGYVPESVLVRNSTVNSPPTCVLQHSWSLKSLIGALAIRARYEWFIESNHPCCALLQCSCSRWWDLYCHTNAHVIAGGLATAIVAYCFSHVQVASRADSIAPDGGLPRALRNHHSPWHCMLSGTSILCHLMKCGEGDCCSHQSCLQSWSGCRNWQ